MTASKIHYMTVAQVQKIVDVQFEPFVEKYKGFTRVEISAAIKRTPDGGGVFPATLRMANFLSVHFFIHYSVQGSKLLLRMAGWDSVPFDDGMERLMYALFQSSKLLQTLWVDPEDEGEEPEEEEEEEEEEADDDTDGEDDGEEERPEAKPKKRGLPAVKDICRQFHSDRDGDTYQYGRVVSVKPGVGGKQGSVTVLWLRSDVYGFKLAKNMLKAIAALDANEPNVIHAAEVCQLLTHGQRCFKYSKHKQGHAIWATDPDDDFNF